MSSATLIDSLKRTFTATVTLAGYELLALGTDGTVSVATATSTQTEVGFLDGERTVNASASAPVRLLNGGGTAYATLASTVTDANTALYPASGGKVGPTTFTGAPTIGYSLQASGSADDVVEILLA